MGDSRIEWLYRHIVEETSIAIIFGDRDGVIRYWNKGAETVFGWSGAEATGKSMDIIIPEKHRAHHWEGYAHVMRSGGATENDNSLYRFFRPRSSRVEVCIFISEEVWRGTHAAARTGKSFTVDRPSNGDGEGTKAG